VRCCELPKHGFAVGRQSPVHLATVSRIQLAGCQFVRNQATGELHRAVMLDLQSLSQLANRDAFTLRKALDRQPRLVLLRLDRGVITLLDREGLAMQREQ